MTDCHQSDIGYVMCVFLVRMSPLRTVGSKEMQEMFEEAVMLAQPYRNAAYCLILHSGKLLL